jgi:pyrimidine deaminase RibD-like protein
VRSSEFEITNPEKLDQLLLALVEMIINAQNDETDFGRVAAGILDTDNRFVPALNRLDHETDTRVHAERAAIDRYHSEVGEIPPGSIIITTLSPCTDPDMSERFDASCDELINSGTVKKVYCGYIDPTQDKNSSKQYHLKETQNPRIRTMCKRIAHTFLD